MTDIASLKRNIAELPKREPVPGLVAAKLSGQNVMIQHVTVQKGTSAPQHHHQNEQIMVLLEGRMILQVGDADKGELTEIDMGPGDVIHLPSGIPHGGEALEDCVVLDVFSPPSDVTGIDGLKG